MKKQRTKRFKTLLIAVAFMFIIFLLVQFIPYGHVHTNPPVILEPKWDSPATRALAKRACFNCHSNETEYPWYAFVAPSSWLLRYDIDHARAAFNFSNWDGGPLLADLMATRINENKMPPWRYLLLHPEAKLSDTEKQQFIDGMHATLNK